MRIILVASLLWLAAGCAADRTLIRTNPASARIYVRTEFVGLSPIWYQAPRREFSTATPFRAELDGFAPVEGVLRTGVSKGRVWGCLFTGVLCFTRPPYTYKIIQEVALPYLGTAPDPRVPSQAPAVGSDARLQRLDDFHRRGLISDAEYKTLRIDIIRSLVTNGPAQ